MSLKKSFLIGLCLFLFHSFAHAEVLGVYKTESGTGWLEKSEQGDLILHLEGTYYDMGLQQGNLLKKEVRLSLDCVKGLLHHYDPLVPMSVASAILYEYTYAKEIPYIPLKYQVELRGVAEGAGVDLKTLQSVHGLIFLASCSSVAAWGNATRDGKLYFIRSLDYPLNFVDPKTGVAIQDNSLIVIYKPRGEIPYLTFNWPGFVGSAGGMNAQGVLISVLTNQSKFENPAGLPMIFRVKQVLDKANSVDGAIRLIGAKPFEGGYNFVIAQTKYPQAIAVEMDAREIYIGGWNGPAESNRYHYRGKEYVYEPIPDVVLRTNHPLSSELISHHRGKIERGKKDDSSSSARYRDLRARVLKEYGNLDLETMNQIMRAHYQGMYQGKNDRKYQPTMHQVAYDPATGDFIIAFAKGDPKKSNKFKVSAYNQPYHRYNFYELLQRKPNTEYPEAKSQ